MKKIIALTLALLLLFSALVSCKKNEEEEGSTTASTKAADEKVSLDSLPDYDFAGRTITILTREEFKYELDNEGDTSSPISQFVFDRNVAIKNRYNVTLNTVTSKGIWSERANYKDKIYNSVMGGDTCEYDIICGAQNQICQYVTEGYFLDLNANKNLNFENAWWFDGFVDNMTINDRLYFTVGDAGPTLLENMNVVIFNKDLCAQNNIELPYDAVRNKSWTLEAMDTMLEKFPYQDTHNDDLVDGGDTFGLVGGGAMLRGLNTSFDMKLVSKDSMGYPEITYNSARTIDIFDQFQAFMTDQNTAYFKNGSTENDDDTFDPMTTFGEGRALMQFVTLSDIIKLRNSYSVNYGVVPYPMYDSAQEDYYTHIYETLTVFTIPANAASAEESGLILEALGAASYDYVTPEYFSIVLQMQNSQDNDSLEMIKLAREKISFNFGFVYSSVIKDIGSMIDNIRFGNYNFSSSWKTKEKNATDLLANLIDKYLEMD